MHCKKIKKKYIDRAECFSKKMSVTEKGKTFMIKRPKGNTEKFCCIHVDDCLITDKTTQKCDFAFIRCKTGDIYYVELKGQAIQKAFNQIVVTLTTHIPCPKEKRYGFIVSSRVPRAGQDVNKLKREFISKHGVALKIESQKIIHQIK